MGLLWSRAFRQDPKAKYSFTSRLPARLAAIPLAAWVVWAVVYGRAEARHIDAEVLMDREFMHPEEGIAAGLAELEGAVNEDPGNLFAWSSLVRKYIEAQKWEDAVRASEMLQQRSPLYPQSSLMKAYALVQLRRPEEALKAIGSELLVRTHPVAYQIRAQAYDQLGNLDGEREALEQTLRGILLSHMRVPYRNLCQRVAELSTTPLQQKEWNALLDSLQKELPSDREFLEKLRKSIPLSEQ
jgi:tetratricopeptide (TPR) repeat protein